MGFITRLINFSKAKANKVMDSVENPIELLDQKIRDMEDSLNRAKIASAQIIGNVHEIENNMKAALEESAEYDRKVRFALSNENEELAKKALERKLDADKRHESLKKSYEESRVKADSIKNSLKQLEDDIEKTHRYRDEASARLNAAETSGTVNEILANISLEEKSISIDDIERKISRKEAQAEGLKELADSTNSFENEFKKLEEVDLDAALDAYRNK